MNEYPRITEEEKDEQLLPQNLNEQSVADIMQNYPLQTPIIKNDEIKDNRDKFRAKMTKYQKLEKQWKKVAFILMPAVTLVNIYVQFTELYSPRVNDNSFNWPEFIWQLGLLVLGYIAIIRSVKTFMLFSCLAYFSFGLMYAYEEVLKETRNVMNNADFNFRYLDNIQQAPLLPPFSKNIYRLQTSIKYARISGTFMFITIGLALYSIRRIKIMRAIGTLKNEDAFRIVYKKVNTFNLEYRQNSKKGVKMLTVGEKIRDTIVSTVEQESIMLNKESIVEQNDQRKKQSQIFITENEN